MKKEINISDINNNALLENINKIEEKIKVFADVIKSTVTSEIKGFFEIADSKSFVKIIRREETNDYKDDGNTHTPGYHYSVCWYLPYKTNLLDEMSVKEGEWFHPDLIQKCIVIEYEVNERIYDKRIKSSFITIELLRNEDLCSHIDSTSQGYHVCNDHIVRIDHNNDNYPLLSVFTSKNAAIISELLILDAKRASMILNIKELSNGKLFDN